MKFSHLSLDLIGFETVPPGFLCYSSSKSFEMRLRFILNEISLSDAVDLKYRRNTTLNAPLLKSCYNCYYFRKKINYCGKGFQ